MGLNGIILVDKPSDWTSHDVVGKLRGILHERRIGHSGTLDPMATGLLVVFVGRATRAVEFAEADSKEYIAGLRLGVSTDTQDITGNTLKSSNSLPSRAELEQALGAFKGEISQMPPMYSAIKVGGRKLYELARRGESVERKPRRVTIDKLEIVGKIDGDYILDVVCSKGTYIRTLCNDIGDSLGCGGCMSALRRTMAAGFTLAESRSIEDVQAQGEALLSPTDSLFRQYPAYHIAGERDHRRCLCGNPLAAEGLQPGLYRVYGPDGAFLCLSRWEAGVLTSEKNFFGA